MSGRRRGSREPLWTRDYLLATTVNLFLTVMFYELVTTTALYAAERFHASGAGAGLAAGAFMIGAVLSRFITGKYIDILGRRRILVVTLAVCIGLPLLCGLVEQLWVFVLIRGLHGAAFGAGSSALSTGALALVPASRRGEGAGYYGLAPVLAAAMGSVLGVMLIGQFGYPVLFASNSVCAAIGLGFALLLRLPERAPTKEDRRNARRWNLSAMIDGPAAAMSSIVFIAAMGLSSVLAFLNSFSASEGFGEVAGTFFLVYAATALVARLVIGRAQDRFGERAVVPPLLAALAAGLAVLAVRPAGAALILSAILVGFGFGALFPVIHAAVFSASPPHRVGMATSTFYLVGDAGIAIGAPLVGAFLPFLDYRGVYLLLAGVTTATIVAYLLVGGRPPAAGGCR